MKSVISSSPQSSSSSLTRFSIINWHHKHNPYITETGKGKFKVFFAFALPVCIWWDHKETVEIMWTDCERLWLRVRDQYQCECSLRVSAASLEECLKKNAIKTNLCLVRLTSLLKNEHLHQFVKKYGDMYLVSKFSLKILRYRFW